MSAPPQNQMEYAAPPSAPSQATPSTTVARTYVKRMVRVAMELRLDIENGPETQPAMTVNLSPTGVCFTTEDPLDEEAVYPLILFLPEGKREFNILKVEARLVWQEPSDEGWTCAARFETFAPGDQRRIKSFLLDRLRS